MKNKLTAGKIMLILGCAIIVFMLLICFFPKMFTSYSTKEMFAPWLEESAEHPLGTNDMGYDIFTELIYAAPQTLLTGVISAVLSVAIGTLMGVLAGYLKGAAKQGVDLIINVFLMLPMLPMAIVISSFMPSGKESIILTLSLLSFSSTSRVVRARAESLREENFIKELKALGVSRGRILFFHIVPNLSEVVFSRFITSVARCILAETTLSFLGLGAADEITWGGMINFAYKRGGFLRGAHSYYLAPGLMIVTTVMAFYFINCYITEKMNYVEITDNNEFLA